MGSQVNFYLMREDEEAFCRFILSDSDATILFATRLDRPYVPVPLPMPEATEPYSYNFALWNRSIANQAQVQPIHKVRDIDNPAGCYDISAELYPVIELLRCSLRSEGLGPGRIWATFEHECLSNEQQRAFRAWFRRLANWLNKLPFRWDMYRIGPHAKAYFDAGGKAIGYGLGEVKAVEAIGAGERLVRRGVKQNIMKPEIERDDGTNDLTIELDE